ncbi:MAG: hypothetical protein PVG41_21510, partial [Desulfobacteraceae bacterium]
MVSKPSIRLSGESSSPAFSTYYTTVFFRLYTFYLRVEAADYPTTDIGIYVSATPDGIGNALFKVKDSYEIVLNITYETDVPAPVVVCDPPSFSLPDMQAGDVLNGEFTLTNHGLIRADNLELHLPPDDEYFNYEILIDLPDSLGAKERITVPYRLTCIQSIDQADEIQSGGGSGGYTSCFYTSYSGVTANGCPYSGSVPHCFGRGGSTPHSGGGGGSQWWYPQGPGGGCYGFNCHGGGTGYGGVSEPIGTGVETCTPAPA